MSVAEYLTVKEALERILSEVHQLPAEEVALIEGYDRILAQAIRATDDIPPFANSAMDGYALRAEDVIYAGSDEPVELKVIDDIAAGSVSHKVIEPGTAARITTGAPVPAGANAIVPVEETSEPWRGGQRPLPEVIKVYKKVKQGDFIRQAGEDIPAGTEILAPGHWLRSQEIGLLASLGYSAVQVYRRPKVAILSTGDELISVDEPLRPGKIRNSNSYTQAAQVLASHALPIPLGVAADSTSQVQKLLSDGVKKGANLLVSSAGVSVGAYDVVKNVMEQEGHVNFWRVRMRPGKPLLFGRFQGIPFLGLPGNPVSAMVSFERFARPAILKMAGWTTLERPTIPVRTLEKIESDGRESYIRVVVSRDPTGYSAVTTGGQGSHMLTSMVKANALLIIPEGVTSVEAGEELTAMMLDWPPTVF